ncbi:MAG: hypothetical protein C0391_03740, partial [Anaerolinea sp.]|nr:hypothetical protein [Anaerolinea sp.]
MQLSPFPPGSLVVAYLRDSGGDKQDLSVTHQQAALQKFAQENNLIITHVFADLARTGTTTVGREKFLEMISYFQQKAPQPPEKGLILWSFSRFARNVNDSDYYKALIRKAGYQVFSLSDYIPQGLDEADQYLMESVHTYTNAKFIVTLRANVLSGVHDNFERNGTLGGVPPRGFKREIIDLGRRKNGEKRQGARWVPDPDLWEVCKRAWQMRAAGRTYGEIHETTHLYNSIASYKTFFENRIYLGEMHFGYSVDLNYAPAMVDQTTWEIVQKFNSRNKSIRDPRTNANPDHSSRLNSSYLLSGIAFCCCGSPLNSHTIKFKRGGRVMEYYRCSTWWKKHKSHVGSIPRQSFEDSILDYIKTKVINERNLVLLNAALERQLAERKKMYLAQRNRYRGLLTVARRELKNLTRLIKINGYISSIADDITRLDKDVVDYQEKLDRMERDNAQVFRKMTEKEIKGLHKYLSNVLEHGTTTEKRRLLRAFIVRIDVQRDGKNISIDMDITNPVLIFSVGEQCPQGNSNPRFGLERATSWATRRWG